MIIQLTPEQLQALDARDGTMPRVITRKTTQPTCWSARRNTNRFGRSSKKSSNSE
jgi:hypothetical protein